MKTPDIKNLFRYCVSKAQEQGHTITKEWSGVFWDRKEEKWKVEQKEVCILGAVVLIKQYKPAVYLTEDLNSEGLVSATITRELSLDEKFVNEFLVGLCFIGEFVEDKKNKPTENFKLGLYFRERLKEGEPK